MKRILSLAALAAVASSSFASVTLFGGGGSIPDNNLTGFSSSVFAPVGVDSIVAVTIFGLTHTWAGDLSATVLYSTGFEPPTFTNGTSVNGIEGWENGSSSGVTHLVSEERSNGGTQSLKWNNSVGSPFSSVRRNIDPYDAARTKSISSSVDLLVTSGTQENRLYGIYLTEELSDTLGGTKLGMTVSGNGIIRAGTSWGETYAGMEQFDLNSTGRFVDGWFRLVLSKNLLTNVGTVSILGEDSSLLWSMTFADVGEIRSVNIGTDFVANSNLLGVGYFDNFALSADPIPEPMTLGTLALGAGLLSARRRRKA